MENKTFKDISCEIIEDLMPSYIDDICSDDSKCLVETHIQSCESCAKKLDRMKREGITFAELPNEQEDILEITNKLKEREKRHKRNSYGLAALSGVLAICLLISVVPKNNMSKISQEPLDTNIAYNDVIGEVSEESLGDYTPAKDYGEIYDYIKEISNPKDGLFGESILYSTEEYAKEAMVEDAAETASGATAENISEESFSSTNIMTKGVDESDISKTDGKYIYNATSSEIIIFDLQAGEASELCRISPEFESPSDIIRQLYVDGNKMAVITEHSAKVKKVYKNQTIVLMYDITDRENAKFLGKYTQDGMYNTSRKVKDMIYLFTDRYLEDISLSKKKALDEDNIGDWFPTINNKKIAPGCVYLPEYGYNTYIISSFDWNAPDKTIDTKVIVNNYVQTYVGESSIYLYSQVYDANRSVTEISQLKYDEGKIRTGATTSIRGYLNDSFAINEYDNHLRVLATESEEGISNTLYIFDENMNQCGRVNNIANGEQLYACRFVGDTGYFVTFLNTDPLFAVDLSDPKNPQIIGEIKISGFSEYLHFWGEDKLLGIGYETDDDGIRQGLKLSMFDISDPENMSEESKVVLKGDYYCPGLYNYKTVLVDPEENVFGFAYQDYSDMSVNYDIYSYENDTFKKIVSEQSDSTLIERIRGHFNRDYFYISRDMDITSILR